MNCLYQNKSGNLGIRNKSRVAAFYVLFVLFVLLVLFMTVFEHSSVSLFRHKEIAAKKKQNDSESSQYR
ncbi:hypothetical protein PAECIP111893_01489 [Paenibacillus plantiphilus]|uniref:Uncharacterized protein n=1 Tax=Paenibacillus plantiphilus TaxID=2905650 RepID=A0ABM9SFI1_9BACL|nr:hypothetical protein PAECIP111893_01489 [Paenibacillus plantiphilus]